MQIRQRHQLTATTALVLAVVGTNTSSAAPISIGEAGFETLSLGEVATNLPFTQGGPAGNYPVDGGQSWYTVSSPDTGIDVIDTEAKSGTQSVRFGVATKFGSLRQDITSATWDTSLTYTLSFWAKATADNAELGGATLYAIDQNDVDPNGQADGVAIPNTNTFTSLDIADGWTEFTLTVTPTDLSNAGVVTGDLISLRLFNNGRGVPPVFLDDFSLEAVPEPGSLALIGMGSLLILRRRRG